MMKHILSLVAAAFVSTAAVGQRLTDTVGLKMLPYSTEEFQKVNGRGAPAILHFTSGKCSICRAQDAYFRHLKNESIYRDFTVLRVDLGKSPGLANDYAVESASTVIVLRSGIETGRSAGESNPRQLWALLETAFGRNTDTFSFYKLPVSDKRIFLIEALGGLLGKGDNFDNIHRYLVEHPEVVIEAGIERELDEVWGILYQGIKDDRLDKDAFKLTRQRMTLLRSTEGEAMPLSAEQSPSTIRPGREK